MINAQPASDLELAIIEPLCAVFRRALREQGLKYTAERARVLDAIVRFEHPFDGEELLASLRPAPSASRPALRVSKATAYRTLKLLQDIGALRRVLVKGEAKYELAQALELGPGGRPGGKLGVATVAIEGASHGKETPAEQFVSAPELDRAAREVCDRLGLSLVRWEARMVVRSEGATARRST
jgi:hypothetical protein